MIRRATIEDRSQIYRLWKGLVKAETETGLVYPKPLARREQWEAWEKQFKLSLGNQGTLFLVDDEAGVLQGFVVCFLNERFFGSPKFFMEVAEMFVLPEYRGKTGFRLMRAVMKAAKTVGCPTLECGALTTPKQTAQTLRAGWKPYVTRYWKEVPHVGIRS